MTLNFFIMEQLPVLAPDTYADPCPWEQGTSIEDWVSQRVLKLTCVANDTRPLAAAANFDPPVHKWKPEERAELEAELDAVYFLLYGVSRDDAEYMLGTFSGVRSKTQGTLSGEGVAERILRHYESLANCIRKH